MHKQRGKQKARFFKGTENSLSMEIKYLRAISLLNTDLIILVINDVYAVYAKMHAIIVINLGVLPEKLFCS